jgi:predicted N-acyltransferase
MTGSVLARIAPGVGAVDAAAWDACAGRANPFVGHTFLSILEESGSATARAGWQPIPVVIEGGDGAPDAIAPAYAKSHSQGE